MNQTVAAMCRTFNVLVEDEYHMKIVEGHELNACLGLCQVSKTREWTNRIPRVERCSLHQRFGSLWRDCGGTFPQKHCKKMESDWHLGIWVGRTSNSNEYILLTQEGVLRCRSVRRLELAERYNKKNMEDAKGLPGIRDHPEITQMEDHSKDENYHEECRDSQRTEDQEQNLHSSTRLMDKPQAARHAWKNDEDFTTRWPAKQDSKSGKTDANPKKRNIRTGTIRTSAGVSNNVGGPSLPQRQLEVTQCDDDCFARQDQNMNGPNWMTNPSQWTNINESKSWTTTHLE